MNLTKKLGIALAAGTLTVGIGATAFAAAAPPDGDRTGARSMFVCAHLDEIEAQQQARLTLLGGRQHLLQEAHDAAAAAGDDHLAAKLQARLERTAARIATVTARQGKLDAWATSHCSTPSPTPG